MGNILENEQFSNIRIVYPNNIHQSVEGIKQLQIFSPSGRLIPITNLATINVNNGDAEIQRENLQSMGVVTGRLENRDLGSTMKEIQQKVASQVVCRKVIILNMAALMRTATSRFMNC